MGGDSAPEAEIAGVLQALAELPDEFLVQLVGRPDAIEAELAKHAQADRSRLEIHEAADVIGMGEKPLAAVRRKPRSSVVVGLTLQKQGRSDAFLSAGNTGAVLAASTMLLGLHDGVDRATVATLFPTGTEPVLVLDGGANLDCSARELVGFAYLGTVYMRDILGRASPVVGLLNVGEEEEKGTAVVREAHQLLKRSPRLSYAGNIEGRDILGRASPVVGLLNVGEEEEKGTAVVREAHQLLKRSPRLSYTGNIEGRDILPGPQRRTHVDVVVCDGFVGNIVLKFYESAGRMFVGMIMERDPAVLERPALRDLVGLLDYSSYGGAPLLGVRGVSIICHGSSSPNAIKNGIRVALQAVKSGLNAHIAAEFAQREPAGRS
jgi:glycerol-3-phosphate acyltransferase PlsX